MKRRDFLSSLTVTSAATGLMTSNFIACNQSKRDQNKVPASVPDTLAGKPLAELIRFYRTCLFEEFLPFVNSYVVDKEYGGFMCEVNVQGQKLTTDKSTWYLGRGLWTYSYLYNQIAKDPEYLSIAEKAVNFIMKTIPDTRSLWPEKFSRTGEPIAPPAPNIYGDMFVALGLQEYAKASGQEKYWLLAREILMKCLGFYDQPDYFPEAAQSYLKTLPLIPGARIGGHWFMFINLITLMLEFRPDPELKAISDRAMDAVLNYHYNPDFDLINEIVNHDLSRPNNDIAQLVYTGHNMETLWMIMAEAKRRQDQDLFEKAVRYFKRNLEVSWDDVYGGVFTSLNNVDKFEWVTRKANWAQEEAMIGLLMIVENSGAQWAKDWYERIFKYHTERYHLKKYGYQLWIDYADRKVTFVEKDYNRLEIFHHPRYLITCINILERMAKKK